MYERESMRKKEGEREKVRQRKGRKNEKERRERKVEKGKKSFSTYSFSKTYWHAIN